MDSRGCYRWTFWGLVVAFMELALAYCLLCASAFVFLAAKFLVAFDLYIPCPCSGILGYKNQDICLRKLLFEWPLRKIDSIQNFARNGLPNEIARHREKEEILGSTMVIADGERRSKGFGMGNQSSDSGLRIKNSGDRESDSDVRRRQSVNRKQKVSGRRRRGKLSLVFSRSNADSALASGSGSSNGSQVVNVENIEGSGAVDDVNEEEFDFRGPADRGDTTNVTDGETDEKREEDAISVNDLMQNDMDTVKTLERALREERAARAALVLELEKERAAAATAADEAMAMILRLQADKASLEMDAKQYERMMEEKFAYDEEEMTVLKEILVRRERENHFLEKELETYKQIDSIPDDDNDKFFVEDDGFDERDYHPRGHRDFATTVASSSQGKEISHSSTSQKGLSSGDVDIENHKEAEAFRNSRGDVSMPDKEQIIYDVHVVEDEIEFHKGEPRELEEIEGSGNSKHNRDDKETAAAADRVKLMEDIVKQLREIVKEHDNVS